MLSLQAINNNNSMKLPLCGWPISPTTNLGQQFDSAKRNEMRDNMITSHHMKHLKNISQKYITQQTEMPIKQHHKYLYYYRQCIIKYV